MEEGSWNTFSMYHTHPYHFTTHTKQFMMMMEYMKKLSAGLKTVTFNYIPVGNTSSTRDLQLQWADIAAAWRAADKPSPEDFHSVVSVDEAVVQECLLLATR